MRRKAPRLVVRLGLAFAVLTAVPCFASPEVPAHPTTHSQQVSGAHAAAASMIANLDLDQILGSNAASMSQSDEVGPDGSTTFVIWGVCAVDCSPCNTVTDCRDRGLPGNCVSICP